MVLSDQLDDKPSVLLVDDEATVRNFVSRALQGNVNLTMAESAERAREKLDGGHYALAMIDVFLPGDDGLALMREVRRRCPGTRILILTGRPSEAVTRCVIQGQADDYLEKPFTLEKLREAVRGLTQREKPASRFDEVCHHVRCHLGEDLRLTTVASRFQMQPSSFSQWFNQEASRRPDMPGYKAFVTQTRVERAQQLLSTTDMLIKEIANAVGFSSHQLLNQHFQEIYSISPTEWRSKHSGHS